MHEKEREQDQDIHIKTGPRGYLDAWYPQTNQATISFSELTCHAGQVVNGFDLPEIIFDLPEIIYNIC